jgi:hypothetical protein
VSPSRPDTPSEALLRVLRGALSPTGVAADEKLLVQLPAVRALIAAGIDAPDAIHRAVDIAVRSLESDDHRHAARLILGWSKSGDTTREQRRSDLQAWIGRQRGRDPVSSRRAEQYERDVLLPVLLQALQGGSLPQAGWRRNRDIFVQFVNPEISGLYGMGLQQLTATQMQDLLERSVRLALLCTTGALILPASLLFEVRGMPEWLSASRDLQETGLIRITSPIHDLGEYRETKKREYRADGENPYRSPLEPVAKSVSLSPWQPRRIGGSAADDIATQWRQAVRPEGALSHVVTSGARVTGETTRRIEAALQGVPERLQGRAFISRFVRLVLDMRLGSPALDSVALFLSRQYLLSYMRDLDANIVTDFPFGKVDCGLATDGSIDGRYVSAKQLLGTLDSLGVRDWFLRYSSHAELVRVASSPEFELIFAALVQDAGPASLRSLVRFRETLGDMVPASTAAEVEKRLGRLASVLAN